MNIEWDEVSDKAELEKNTSSYFLLHFWMENMEQGKNIIDFFLARNYKNIAIYGLGILGRHLRDQLVKNNAKIVYCFDKGKICCEDGDYDIEKKIDALPIPDVIVVTPIMEYITIKENLKQYIDTNIVSLEEVIRSI